MNREAYRSLVEQYGTLTAQQISAQLSSVTPENMELWQIGAITDAAAMHIALWEIAFARGQDLDALLLHIEELEARIDELEETITQQAIELGEQDKLHCVKL